jgi:peptide/nickel transport system permease protein
VKAPNKFSGFWHRLARHRLAAISAVILALLYLCVIFANFLAPQDPAEQGRYNYLAPTPMHIFYQGHLVWPYVSGLTGKRDPVTFALTYQPDSEKHYPIKLFVHSWHYRLLGLIPTDLHLFGSAGPLFLFGSDTLGRDLFSRTITGSRVSMTIGIIVVLITFPFGLLIGGLSGYLGGRVDFFLQRLIEVLLSVPTLPLLLALSMLIPAGIPPFLSFLEIILVLAVLGWTGFARIVRGQFLALREVEYVVSSRSLGASNVRTIFRHMAPNLASYLIISATLSVPGYILAESALSFLGLGIHPPLTSWGLLLSAALNSTGLNLHPWILIPGGFIVLAVLCFNFLGDGLRDVADPHQT